MKQTLFILALLTASIQTFAQSPRIKLNQITKDSISGSVLISSPTDSGMVYSRDLFISYGADTVLILGGDTIVLQSDLIAEISDSLLNYVSRTELSDSTANIRTDIPLIIADSLLNYVNISGTQTITGAKTFTSALTQSGGDVNFDSGTLFVDEDLDRVGIGTSSPNVQLHLQDGASEDVSGSTIRMDLSGINPYWEIQARNGVNTANRKLHFYTNSFGSNEVLTLTQAGYVGIGTDSPSAKLDVVGNTELNGALNQSGGDVNFDSGTLFVDEDLDRVGIGTSSPNVQLHLQDGASEDVSGSTIRMDLSGINPYWEIQARNGVNAANRKLHFYTNFIGGNEVLTLTQAGYVGIGTTSPSEKLEVNGKVKISDLTGTGGNAVYENGGVLGVASDARFKSHIADLDNGIEKILNLKPKYFIDNRNSAFQQLGFYAQEVKSVINEASYPIGNTDYLGINDRAIIAVTVKAIQEQQAIIESQATEIETLKTLITDLSNRLTIIENN